MNILLFLFLTLAVMIAASRILTLLFPAARSGRRLYLLIAAAILVFLPPVWQILRGDEAVGCICAITTATLTLAALIDCRQRSTAYELYPILIGLVSVPILVINLITGATSTGKLISSPAVGLLSGLGIAVLASLLECILSKKETIVLSSVSMCTAIGFFAGFPHVVWVLGAGFFLCFCEWLIRAKLLKKPRFYSFNGILAFSLVYYLALRPLFF